MLENVIVTPDLHFAAYLKAKKCEIINVQRQFQKTIFSFNVLNSGFTQDELKHGYFNNSNGKFSICGSEYADAIRSLKTLCYVDIDGSNFIITPDLYFAAYLKSKKCFVNTISQKDSKTVFVFDISNSNMIVLELILGYFNNSNDSKFVVNASDFTDSIRSLKTMCHITADN